MPNIISVNYERTGQSTKLNSMGMRDMQQKAYEARNSQYILLKSPPASGKSRALMFLGLDKLFKQGIKKIIVAVPERSIGSSFSKTNLKDYGFFSNWEPNDIYNLCTPGNDGSQSKVKKFHEFMNNSETILICTHATLRFACEGLDEKIFNNSLMAIDEFHHISADVNNKLGEILRNIMNKSEAHIIAMTGSYFRGDSIPVLRSEDEAKFTKVTYNYYEQLNGYNFLKSLGIGYHFYQGKYMSSIMEVLDTDKKTIIHIPNVNAGESTKDKYTEVDTIFDLIGELEKTDNKSGIHYIKRHKDGKLLKVADLVDDNPQNRDKIVNYLREVKNIDDIDLIIALGMAKEGFDWPYCEHVLTVGYRGSLTEIIQIIGRATRDSFNKTHAQFTNLIAQPIAEDEEVRIAVNNMLKAITASLLMEQVLAPNFKFKTKNYDDKSGTLEIKGLKEPSTNKVKKILESDLDDLKAAILQNSSMQKAIPGNLDPEIINRILIPKVIKEKYPDLSVTELEEVRQYVVTDSVIKSSEIKEIGDKKFLSMAGKFINLDDLHIDLIDKINPFQKAFEILSKNVTKEVLKVIKDTIDVSRIQMTDDEAVILYNKVIKFQQENNRFPDINSINSLEKRMAEAILFLQNKRRQYGNK
ncbi:MAG: DEAD/DEAH box helicase [Fusobacteriaceae bacterium]